MLAGNALGGELPVETAFMLEMFDSWSTCFRQFQSGE